MLYYTEFIVIVILILIGIGAVLGLIPFFLGRYFGKPGLGKLGLLVCCLASLLYFWTAYIPWSLIACIAFSVAVFVKRYDFPWPQKKQPQPVSSGSVTYEGASRGLNVICLSGPMKGQIYGIGPGGIKFGRDTSCAVRFPSNTAGISRQHCAIRFQQGVPVLVDLGSSHGTYLGSGQKLPPQYPVEIAAGSRFYLGTTGCLFQVTVA